MRRALLLTLGAAICAATILTPALADARFADPAGDATGTAPDITAVTVSDDAGGNILFHVAAANFTPESEVVLWLDTDRNASTGDEGFEYQLGVMLSADKNNDGWWFGGWDGNRWDEAPHTTVLLSGDTTWVEFRVNRSDLDSTKAIAFQVWSARYTADEVTGRDHAPDGDMARYTYQLTLPARKTATTPAGVRPVFGLARTVPARPMAGQKVVFTLPVVRSDTGAPLTTGTMICDPSVSGTVIEHAESFTHGVAKLTFVVPRTASGKLLKVKVTIVFGGRAATRIALYRLK